MGLFVCLEPADRHGGRQGPNDWAGHGPGQLWSVGPIRLVGRPGYMGDGSPVPPGENYLGGSAPVPALGEVPCRHVSLVFPLYFTRVPLYGLT